MWDSMLSAMVQLEKFWINQARTTICIYNQCDSLLVRTLLSFCIITKLVWAEWLLIWLVHSKERMNCLERILMLLWILLADMDLNPMRNTLQKFGQKIIMAHTFFGPLQMRLKSLDLRFVIITLPENWKKLIISLVMLHMLHTKSLIAV